MKIRIEQIPDSGLELAQTYEPVALDLESVDVEFIAPIQVSVWAEKGIHCVSIKLKIETTLRFSCSRCLEEIIAPFSKECKFTLPIEEEKEIDITDNLREEIILGYPLKSLCRADCRGLCPTCGQNLNKAQCGCN